VSKQLKNITVITNKDKDIDLKITNEVIKILNKYNCNVNGDSKADLVICLGGDGTIINNARKAAIDNIPILGINMGRVGYTAELETDEVYLLEKIFTGEYTYEYRMMLKVNDTYIALNDAVIRGTTSHIAEFELKCDGKLLTRYRADGLIISTPTGSTAYSFSAGGPVIDPKLDCFCITPICSHSLNTKSLIFSPDSVLEIINKCRDETDMILNLDGNNIITINYNSSVVITKSDIRVKMLRIKKDSFYCILNKKMSE